MTDSTKHGVTKPDAPKPDAPKPGARERILRAAYDLFSRRGVRDVGVDEIIKSSGVAIATFYRHFASKDDLVTAFLRRREQLWTSGTIVAQARKRSAEPRDQLLAIFDIFDEWFQRKDFEGDSFVNVLIEMGPQHPLGQASIAHLDNVRSSICMLANEGHLRDPEDFARSWQLLMKGAIITARMGDFAAAVRARKMATWLLEEHSPGLALAESSRREGTDGE